MRRALIVLLALWGAALLSTASMPHHETDGLFFGAIGRSIVESGDWLTLRYAPTPEWVVDKPPLTFWITALSLKIGRQSRAALRLWHLLATIGLVVTAYAIARLALRVESALLAALILGTMLQIVYQSLTPQQDIPLALGLALAFYAWLRHQRTGSGVAAALAGVAVGLTTLTKGLAAPAMFATVAVVQAALVWRRERRWPWRARAVFLATAATVIVAAPWFVYSVVAHGRPFIDTMILGRTGVDRFFHPRLRPPVPYWQALMAYIPMLAGGVLPWTGLIPAAIARGRDAVRGPGPADAESRTLAFCLVWFATVLIALVVSPGDKVYRYLVPLLVPLAVLMAAALDRETARSRLLGATCLVAGAACAAMWIALLWARSGSPEAAALYVPMAIPVAVVMTIAAVVAGIAMLAEQPRAMVCALAAGGVLMILALQWSVRTRWDALWPWPQMAARVHAHADGGRVVVFGSGGPFSGPANAAAFYFHAPVLAVDDDGEFARLWQRETLYAVLPRHAAARVPDVPRGRILVESPLGWRLMTNRQDGR